MNGPPDQRPPSKRTGPLSLPPPDHFSQDFLHADRSIDGNSGGNFP